MHHGFALLLLIASAPIFCLALELREPSDPPPTFSHDPHDSHDAHDEGSSATPNVFAVGTQSDGSKVEGTVAHALGDEGVKKHLQNLQGEAKKEWEANLVLDYSLFNYRKTIAEMTKQCIKLMDEMREDMAYETSTIVNKEVDRVWPTLEMQGDMKTVADIDKVNGIKGPCYIDKKTGEKVDESFMLQSYYPKKELWKAYLESQLHKGDHELMGTAVGSTADYSQPSPRVESSNQGSTGTGGNVERPPERQNAHSTGDRERPSDSTPRAQTSSSPDHSTQSSPRSAPPFFVEAKPLERKDGTCTEYFAAHPPSGKRCGRIDTLADCFKAKNWLESHPESGRTISGFEDYSDNDSLAKHTMPFCSVKIQNGGGGNEGWHVKFTPSNKAKSSTEGIAWKDKGTQRFRNLCGCWDH